MKLLILGATGDIGEAVLKAAVSAGHDVTAFVRSPDKLGDVGDRVHVIQGDLTDAAAIASAMTGRDAVISAIGSSPDKAQLDAPATAVRLILAAMGSAGVRRFVGLAGGAVNVPGSGSPSAAGSPPPSFGCWLGTWSRPNSGSSRSSAAVTSTGR